MPVKVKKVQDVYKFRDNTYLQEVKSDPKDRIEIEVGDIKDPSTFYEQIKIKRWDNEVNASFRLIDSEPKTLTTKANKIKLIGAKKEVHFYDIAPNEEHPEGAYELEIILKTKPASNVLEFSIQTKGLDFFYQFPLTQKRIDEGAERPENVVGSYAVYHKTKGGMNDSAGMEYKVGKAFHIYRPKVTDANGNSTWGKLNVSEQKGLFTVTINQTWLNNAVYPVVVDPTFGYTSAGGSSRITYSGQFSLDAATGIAGTGDSISAYIADSDTDSSNAQYALYDASDNLVTNGVTDENTAVSNSASWVTLNFSTSPTLTAQTYYLAVWSDEVGGPSGNVNIYYDSSGGDGAFIETSVTYSTWPDPVTRTTDSAVDASGILSIYATYTATAVDEDPESFITLSGVGN